MVAPFAYPHRSNRTHFRIIFWNGRWKQSRRLLYRRRRGLGERRAHVTSFGPVRGEFLGVEDPSGVVSLIALSLENGYAARQLLLVECVVDFPGSPHLLLWLALYHSFGELALPKCSSAVQVVLYSRLRLEVLPLQRGK